MFLGTIVFEYFPELLLAPDPPERIVAGIDPTLIQIHEMLPVFWRVVQHSDRGPALLLILVDLLEGLDVHGKHHGLLVDPAERLVALLLFRDPR